MSKATLPMEQLKKVCMIAFSGAELPISNVELVMVEKGARANWDLCAISPEPSYETAERVYKILVDLQNSFALAGKPIAVMSVLS